MASLEPQSVVLQKPAGHLRTIFRALRNILWRAHKQQDWCLFTEVKLAAMGVADILLSISNLGSRFNSDLWGEGFVRIAEALTAQLLESSLPAVKCKMEKLVEAVIDPQVPAVEVQLHVTAVRCSVEEVAWSIGPSLAHFLGGLTLDTVFATGALRMLGVILDPDEYVMPLPAHHLDDFPVHVLTLVNQLRHMAAMASQEHSSAEFLASFELFERQVRSLWQFEEPLKVIHEDLMGFLTRAYCQKDELLTSELHTAVMRVSHIREVVHNPARSFWRGDWGDGFVQMAEDLTKQQLELRLPVMQCKVEELAEVLADPQVPAADWQLCLTALQGTLEEVAMSIGPNLAEFLGGLTLGTVFATGTLQLLAEILDPEGNVMPLTVADFSPDSVPGLADDVSHLATLRCGEDLELLLAPHFFNRVAHLAQELAVQPANNADQGLLEFLKEEVVSNFAALPSNERAAPGTVSDFMVQAVQRMGAPGQGVGGAVRAVRELVNLYRALRGPATDGVLTAVTATRIAPKHAPPASQHGSVRHSLYEPLELPFSEELFTKLAGIISSTLPAYRIADDVFLVELFEEAIVPLLEFLEELLCDGLLVSEERADVIKGLVGQVGQAMSEVTRALTASLMIKIAQNEPLDDNPVLLRTAQRRRLAQQEIADFEKAQAEAQQAELAAVEAAQQVEALVLNAAGPSDSEESEEGAPAESQGGMAGQGLG